MRKQEECQETEYKEYNVSQELLRSQYNKF